jgi:hypothetical protein
VPAAVVHLDAAGDLRHGRGPRRAGVLWPYTQGWREPLRREAALVDPVNLLVLNARPERVGALLERRGWRVPTEGGLQVIWVGGWLPRAMAAHLERGGAEERDHVRLWRFGPHTVAGAHHEVRGPGGRGHAVTSWNAARDQAAADLAAAGLVPLPASAPITPPDLRGRPSDGRAARLIAPVPR